jgi:putative hemolysin
MTLTIALAVIVVSVACSAFFSGTETGLYCVNRARLQLRVRQQDRRALRLSELVSDEGGTLTVTLIGVNVADFLFTNATAYLFSERLNFSAAEVEFYTVALVAPMVFVFCTVVPKNLFQMHADWFMLLSAGGLAAFGKLFRLTGFVWCLRRLADYANRWTIDPPPDLLLVEPKRKIASMLRDSLAHHETGTAQSGLIEQVLQLSEVSVQSVMVSASRITVLSGSCGRDDVARAARETMQSRLPVCGTNRRKILGVVNLDAALADEGWRTVAALVEPALRIGPYETVATALKLLQTSGQELAVVVDRSGQLLGIITLRILLDVILGALTTES